VVQSRSGGGRCLGAGWAGGYVVGLCEVNLGVLR